MIVRMGGVDGLVPLLLGDAEPERHALEVAALDQHSDVAAVDVSGKSISTAKPLSS
jgi:hypothetical protein